MKNFFSNNLIILAYFFLLGFIGLFTKTFFKNLLDKYGVFNLMLIEATIGLIVLIPVLFYRKTVLNKDIIPIFESITSKELLYLILLGVFGIGTGYIGSNFVKNNSVSKLLVLDIVIGISLSFVGMHFIEKKTITKKQLGGLILICTGAYLIL